MDFYDLSKVLTFCKNITLGKNILNLVALIILNSDLTN